MEDATNVYLNCLLSPDSEETHLPMQITLILPRPLNILELFLW